MIVLVVVVAAAAGGGDDDDGVVVVIMPITVGDDAIDGDVVGDDDDDSGWGALNWGTCKCLVVWVHVLLSCRLPYLQIIRWLYVQARFILTNFAKHAAIHEKAHLCDVIFWNSPCVFAMRCGKNRTLFDFLPARQIIRAGSACMEMIHGFKEGWIIWHRHGYPRGWTRAG